MSVCEWVCVFDFFVFCGFVKSRFTATKESNSCSCHQNSGVMEIPVSSKNVYYTLTKVMGNVAAGQSCRVG